MPPTATPPHRILQAEILKLSFPALELWVAWSALLPSCPSWFIGMEMWDRQLPSCLPSPSGGALPCVLSALSAHLCHSYQSDECLFFNSLVVGFPYSSIFWQVWLYFVLKFVIILLLTVQGGKVYLPMPPSWLEVSAIEYLYLTNPQRIIGKMFWKVLIMEW